MAYDERLAERVREAVAGHSDVTEIKMFGGLCFTKRGNMFVGVVGDELMVRADPGRHEELLAQPHARPMDFTGRPMKGFLFVAPAGIKTARALEKWIRLSLDYVEPMPPKTPKARRRTVRATPRKR